MKLLLDENLPPALARDLADLFPESSHVHLSGLGSADDRAIWDFARQHGFAIVSKDSDFHDLSVLLGAPPKVVWLRTGNCGNAALGALLRAQAIRLHDFDSSEASVLLLGG